MGLAGSKVYPRVSPATIDTEARTYRYRPQNWRAEAASETSRNAGIGAPIPFREWIIFRGFRRLFSIFTYPIQRLFVAMKRENQGEASCSAPNPSSQDRSLGYVVGNTGTLMASQLDNLRSGLPSPPIPPTVSEVPYPIPDAPQQQQEAQQSAMSLQHPPFRQQSQVPPGGDANWEDDHESPQPRPTVYTFDMRDNLTGQIFQALVRVHGPIPMRVVSEALQQCVGHIVRLYGRFPLVQGHQIILDIRVPPHLIRNVNLVNQQNDGAGNEQGQGHQQAESFTVPVLNPTREREQSREQEREGEQDGEERQELEQSEEEEKGREQGEIQKKDQDEDEEEDGNPDAETRRGEAFELGVSDIVNLRGGAINDTEEDFNGEDQWVEDNLHRIKSQFLTPSVEDSSKRPKLRKPLQRSSTFPGYETPDLEITMSKSYLPWKTKVGEAMNRNQKAHVHIDSGDSAAADNPKELSDTLGDFDKRTHEEAFAIRDRGRLSKRKSWHNGPQESYIIGRYARSIFNQYGTSDGLPQIMNESTLFGTTRAGDLRDRNMVKVDSDVLEESSSDEENSVSLTEAKNDISGDEQTNRSVAGSQADEQGSTFGVVQSEGYGTCSLKLVAKWREHAIPPTREYPAWSARSQSGAL
ncbi:hypothetical protein BDZ91DRAFT_764003 [Kalaharituber pfeilii]|nr:hypothetical protein BDZ91DRAFT_764003 [Kalaharituber pfeilii]